MPDASKQDDRGADGAGADPHADDRARGEGGQGDGKTAALAKAGREDFDPDEGSD